ncbi:hypothetical protein J41TS4_34630 [Paenibacillus apis]|uniref:Uncharacterized protein n=1 Tax=Paenibacillus apis TaxID=1792174 RepID=A0A920CLQ9_9BACL|nr:hypothetical protein J41TS4_34630 [Paenibacillus apis]
MSGITLQHHDAPALPCTGRTCQIGLRPYTDIRFSNWHSRLALNFACPITIPVSYSALHLPYSLNLVPVTLQ